MSAGPSSERKRERERERGRKREREREEERERERDSYKLVLLDPSAPRVGVMMSERGLLPPDGEGGTGGGRRGGAARVRWPRFPDHQAS